MLRLPYMLPLPLHAVHFFHHVLVTVFMTY